MDTRPALFSAEFIAALNECGQRNAELWNQACRALEAVGRAYGEAMKDDMFRITVALREARERSSSRWPNG